MNNYEEYNFKDGNTFDTNYNFFEESDPNTEIYIPQYNLKLFEGNSLDNNPINSYSCDCSKVCSEIYNCEEAYYQLNNCGCYQRDGDGDGIPCEWGPC